MKKHKYKEFSNHEWQKPIFVYEYILPKLSTLENVILPTGKCKVMN